MISSSSAKTMYILWSVAMMTERGQKMIQDYGIMSSPGVIVNGELFSVGGFDKNKLIEKIKSLN